MKRLALLGGLVAAAGLIASCGDRSAQNADGSTQRNDLGVAATTTNAGVIADTGRDTGAGGDIGGAGDVASTNAVGSDAANGNATGAGTGAGAAPRAATPSP